MYFLDTNFRESKSVLFELKQVYGIGKTRAEIICQKLGLSPNYKFINLTSGQLAKLASLTISLKLNSELKRVKNLTGSKLISIKSYRGLRRIKGFPVRGQRTRTNARTSTRSRGKY